GRPTLEQRTAFPFPLYDVFNLVIARYWSFEFFDEGNVNGFIRLPRLFIATGYQPSERGINYGAQIGFETDTRTDTTLGGRRIYDRQPVARLLNFEIPAIDLDEALNSVHDIPWSLGIDKQLFFIFNP